MTSSDSRVGRGPGFCLILARPRTRWVPAEASRGPAHALTLVGPGHDAALHYDDPDTVATSPDGEVTLLVLGELVPLAAGRAAERALRAYLVHGTRFVEELSGLFCAVVLDRRDGSVLVATDRLNSRRVFFGARGGRWAYASSLYLHPFSGAAGSGAGPGRPMAGTLDPVAVASMLASGSVHNHRTLFRDVGVLERAGTYRLGVGGPARSSHWECRFAPEEPGSEAGLGPALLERVEHAVAVRHDPARPTLLALSGGLDCRGILGFLRSSAGARDVRCFSYAHGEPAPDSDEAVAGVLASACGYPHELVPSFGGDVESALRHNAVLGGGVNHFCHEVEAWLTLGARSAERPGPVLFVGDEWLGWKAARLKTPRDALEAVHVHGLEGLAWIRPALPGGTWRELRDGLEDDRSALLARHAGHRDLQQLMDALYLDQRLGDVLLPARTSFPGRWFTLADPFLDDGVLDLMLRVPSHLRRGKRLYREAIAGAFPELFAVEQARSASFESYLAPALFAARERLVDHLRTTDSPLDELIPKELLVRALEGTIRIDGRERFVPWRIRSRLFAPRRRVPPAKLLERALLLRRFLGEAFRDHHAPPVVEPSAAAPGPVGPHQGGSPGPSRPESGDPAHARGGRWLAGPNAR